jgi:GntR family transcriptional regulator
VRRLAVDLRINANTVAKVYAELERTGTLETRRGVGTFVARTEPVAARRSFARKADHEPELRRLADRFLADAFAHGYSLDEVIAHLSSRRSREKKNHG